VATALCRTCFASTRTFTPSARTLCCVARWKPQRKRKENVFPRIKKKTLGFEPAKRSPFRAERFATLRALCAVSEGADVVDVGGPAAEVLRNALLRLCIFGGRTDMRRLLGSVYAGAVVRFLGAFRCVVSREIQTPGVRAPYNSVAVTRDGKWLLVGIKPSCRACVQCAQWHSRAQ
jgi:hypothetical protein